MTCTLRNEGVLLTKRSPLHTQPPCHRRSIDRDCQVTGQCYARQRVNVSAPGSGQEEDFETMPFIRPRHRMQPKTEKKNVEYLVHRAIRGAKSAQDRVHDVFRRSMITTEQFGRPLPSSQPVAGEEPDTMSKGSFLLSKRATHHEGHTHNKYAYALHTSGTHNPFAWTS